MLYTVPQEANFKLDDMILAKAKGGKSLVGASSSSSGSSSSSSGKSYSSWR